MYTYKHFGGGLVAISATSFFNLCVDSVGGTVHSSERQRRTKGRAYLRTEALVEGSMPAHTALTTWCSQRATKHAHEKNLAKRGGKAAHLLKNTAASASCGRG